MTHHFTIKGQFFGDRTLPGLNEYLHECVNPKAANRIKQQYQMIISNAVRLQTKRLKIEKPIIIHYEFYEIDKRRDKSNILAIAAKFIEDALQQCGVIKNDGWSEIENFTHEWLVDKDNPRIEVYLEEID